jgi:hypothetical protein
MLMRRPIIPILIVILVVGVIGAGVWTLATSNLLRTTGTVQFSPGTNGLNDMVITGPADALCTQYYLAQTDIDPSAPLRVGGWGVTKCPMYGGTDGSASYYPDTGGFTDNIPLDQPVLVYETGSSTQLYVLITRDRAVFDRIIASYDGTTDIVPQESGG